MKSDEESYFFQKLYHLTIDPKTFTSQRSVKFTISKKREYTRNKRKLIFEPIT